MLDAVVVLIVEDELLFIDVTGTESSVNYYCIFFVVLMVIVYVVFHCRRVSA